MNLSDPLTKNRTEEFNDDVFENFVIPPFFGELSREFNRKPIVIEGGRGSGKTMLLKYLSHRTQFSSLRKNVPENYFQNVGIYWKFDIQFMSALVGKGQSEEYWRSVFEHALALNLSLEVIDSLATMSSHRTSPIPKSLVDRLTITGLRPYGFTRSIRIDSLKEKLIERKRQLEFWINNTSKKKPDLLPGSHFLAALIEEIKHACPPLENVTYFVYLDEYENLGINQQRVVNTYLKSSRSPLIFNVAVKCYGMKVKETTSHEQVKQPDDFRVFNLDELIAEKFTTFSSEVLLLRLKSVRDMKTGINIKLLQDLGGIERRSSDSYQQSISAYVRKLLPGLTERELALEVFNNENLFSQLRREVGRALTIANSQLPVNGFLDPNFPEASIIIPPLLIRQNDSPEDILEELNNLRQNKPSRFLGTTNWIQTNFIGAYINLYVPHARTCPFYGGFGTFIKLSAGNLRHFLELCLQSLKKYQKKTGYVDIYDQAHAAYIVSNQFLREVRNSGPYGDSLYNFAMSLGHLFSLSHRRPGLQQPEVTHFSLRGTGKLSIQDEEFLKEALKWNVLLSSASTKESDPIRSRLEEYTLNPIYSVSFFISYRKKLKIEIDIADFEALRSGSPDRTQAVFKKFEKRWRMDTSQPELF